MCQWTFQAHRQFWCGTFRTLGPPIAVSLRLDLVALDLVRRSKTGEQITDVGANITKDILAWLRAAVRHRPILSARLGVALGSEQIFCGLLGRFGDLRSGGRNLQVRSWIARPHLAPFHEAAKICA